MANRGPLFWIVLAAVGLVAVFGIAALVIDDHSGETVSAGEWAQSVCGAYGVWRGELEAIVEDIRTPTAAGSGAEEPQSETPQGRSGFIRAGLESAVQATETLVEAVDNAGTPDTPQGEQVADLVSSRADDAHDQLEDAEDSLDDEADSLEASLKQVADAVRALASVLALGTKTVADVVRTDPQLASVLRNTSTCQQFREETT